MLLERTLEELATRAIREALGLEEDAPPLLRGTQDPKFGDFQLNDLDNPDLFALDRGQDTAGRAC